MNAFFTRWRDLILPIGVIASVLVIIVPLPPVLLDLLLASNIAVSVIILLTTVYVRSPLEFSVFPSLLLATTLARLVLNVASTRLILSHADSTGLAAAGQVLMAFGNFVAGDRLVVGIIIFAIIIIIQFVVITKGATRISEVAARFTLDGMPGRQMAIDADLNAGLIDEREARRRREEISAHADFYAAMDGASKFVRGDAIAGIVITLINIVGGFAIGTLQGNLNLAEAAERYTKLTIGDGLASQVPAFLISLAAGFLVTRSTQQVNLPTQFLDQLFSRPRALAVTAGFLGMLMFTQLPTLPLLMLGGGCVGLSLVLTQQGKAAEQRQRKTEADEAARTAAEKAKPSDENVKAYLALDAMELELSLSLVNLAKPERGGDLLGRLHGMRNVVASDIGIVVPSVRIRDNLRLAENKYRIKIAGNAVAEGSVIPEKLLAMDMGHVHGKVPGIEMRDPAFNLPAVWIDRRMADQAKALGYTVADASAVISTHLQETVRQYADELLTRDRTKELIDKLQEKSPVVVNELIPGVLKLSDVQQVLQMLLREQVPIRQLGTILEALGDVAPRTKDPIWLTEHVRHRLKRTLCSRYRDSQGKLHVITFDPALEDRIAAGLEHTERGLFVRMSPAAVQKTVQLIATEVQKLTAEGHRPLVLVSPQIRPGLKQLTSAELPKLVVLSHNEITRDTLIESVGLVADAKGEVRAAK